MLDAHLQFTQSSKLIHLGVTGSIAAVKSLELMRLLQKLGFLVSVTLTPSAQKFIQPLAYEALGATKVFSQMFSGDTFEHLEVSQNAELMLIAPASATTMARIAHGLADELLACQALAMQSPIIFAPAMNPKMWANQATQANKKILEERGAFFVGPDEGLVACGDLGAGRFSDLRDIVIACLYALTPKDLAGQKVLINYGATVEYFDPIRFFTNASSGIMGASLAVAAYLRGAEVFVVEGNCQQYLPQAIHREHAPSARQMYQAMDKMWDEMDIVIFTAAVADYSPKDYHSQKFKKSQGELIISMQANPDIAKSLSMRKTKQKVAVFAAESENLETSAKQKLQNKNADLVIGNYLVDGFATSDNSVYMLDKNNNSQHLKKVTKPILAMNILEWLNKI